MPDQIEKLGKVVLRWAAGFGVAPLYPLARAFKAVGNAVTVIMGARSSDLLIYRAGDAAGMRQEVLVTTDDGSKGLKGVVNHGPASRSWKTSAGLSLRWPWSWLWGLPL